MEIQIDTRTGSNKLIEKFPGECIEAILDFGDIAFFGNGPDNTPWYIGIEYKKIDDFVGSMKSGRFTGTQLPGMIRLFDICFVIIEGISYLDRTTGMLCKKMGRNSYGLGIHYKGYHNFMTSVAVHSALAGKPCIIKQTVGIEETVGVIRATYDWFQKPWEWHTSISRPDLTKIQRVSYDLEVLKVDPETPEYPKYWLRKAIFQLERMGWDIAGSISDKFQTMEAVLKASQRDFEEVDRVGKGLAARLYKALHGYPDPEIEKRKRPRKETANEAIQH